MSRRQLPFLIALALGLVWLWPEAADASARTHTVQPGQRLGSIAKRYRVSIEALCRANDIQRNTKIHPGDELVIPDPSGKAQGAPKRGEAERRPKVREPSDPVVHVVSRGQRLGSIAKRYRVSVQAICATNSIDPKAPIKPGQRLLVPAPDDPTGKHARSVRAEYVDDLLPATPRGDRRSTHSWKKYQKAPRRRGYVVMSGKGGSYSGYVIGPGGRVLPAARRAISQVLTPVGEVRLVSTRLVKLIAKTSDTFGGRPLRVVSGWRSKSASAHSRHLTGNAVDFSIPGVPNEALRDYLHGLPQVGVGYYPNSSFVHLDVREAFTTWVDEAGPGEAPRYR